METDIKMKYFIIILTFFGAINCNAELERDRGVLVLKEDNFQTALDTYDHVLVEFYAPWCGHCKALEPEYVKAAEKLQELNSVVQLAKVDATEQQELAKKFSIRGFPTLKFFNKDKHIDYRGGRTAEEIVKWVVKKTDPSQAAERLTSLSQVQEFIEKEQIAVVGVFQDLQSDSAKNFLSAAQNNDNVKFAITDDGAVRQEFGLDKDAVVLFKKFDERKVILDADLSVGSITDFVYLESLPLLVEMNRSNSNIFRGEIKNHLLFFLSKSAEKSAEILDTARSVAKEFRGKVVFISVDIDNEGNTRLRDYFGVKPDHVPTMRILNIGDENLKYKPENDFSVEYVKSVVQDYLDGKLSPHYLSQQLPEDWDQQPVKVLVASNFDSVALDESKHVLVEFYAPWCGHCKKLEPIYNNLAEKFSESPDVVIAKMDSTQNELQQVKLKGFPTIKLYKKGTNQVIDYAGQRTLEALTEFLEKEISESSTGESKETGGETKDEL